MPENWQTAGFGLYIHWPYCAAKCPYCDFNSHVVSLIDQQRWKRAYLSEIDRIGAETGDRVLRSVFFGGGTPSLMEPDLVHGILDAVRSTWKTSNDFEVTLEANPTSVEAGRFAGYRNAGVNRVSLGVQALDDAALKALGRLHTVSEALAALEIARSQFQRISFDLIYARQHQTVAEWRRELREALSMSPEHLSLYQLTIEDGTAFGERFRRGLLKGLPSEDTGADLYHCTQDMCEAAELPAYEVSNHAKPGLESRHNQVYWRGGDYAGIGPGAHGRLSFASARLAIDTALSPVEWLRKVEQTGSGEESRQILNASERDVEYLMMGLRTREGIDPQLLFNFVSLMPNIRYLEGIGLLATSETRIAATDTGRPLLNSILRKLLSDPA